MTSHGKCPVHVRENEPVRAQDSLASESISSSHYHSSTSWLVGRDWAFLSRERTGNVHLYQEPLGLAQHRISRTTHGIRATDSNHRCSDIEYVEAGIVEDEPVNRSPELLWGAECCEYCCDAQGWEVGGSALDDGEGSFPFGAKVHLHGEAYRFCSCLCVSNQARIAASDFSAFGTEYRASNFVFETKCWASDFYVWDGIMSEWLGTWDGIPRKWLWMEKITMNRMTHKCRIQRYNCEFL